MRVPYFPSISPLSLAPAWNDAIHSGGIPLEAKDGTQFLAVSSSSIMSIKNTPTSWDIEIIDVITLRRRYQKNNDPFNLALKKAKSPFLLDLY